MRRTAVENHQNYRRQKTWPLSFVFFSWFGLEALGKMVNYLLGRDSKENLKKGETLLQKESSSG